ncbi:MAG: hypothetical protein RJA07_2671 [Bacteroidota bacterium]|jgi:hypothetical protein
MDILDEDILSMWFYLDKFKVKYIMIGGFATNLHGFQRYTGDCDVWLKDTLENRKNLRIALHEYGLPDMESLETLDFVPGWSSIMLIDGYELDILTEVKGLENIPFDECLDLASIAELNGINVPFLHINHLIASKEATARPKDLIDIIELEKIRNFRNTK